MSATKKDAAGKITWESGIDILPEYGPAELAASGGSDAIAHSGDYPFTRGIHP
jgi:hypothetical protein